MNIMDIAALSMNIMDITILLMTTTSLENDPNMRLQQCGGDMMPCIDFGKQLFQSGDDGKSTFVAKIMIELINNQTCPESILSMELCSGPPSLSLPPPADESSLVNVEVGGTMGYLYYCSIATPFTEFKSTRTAQ